MAGKDNLISLKDRSIEDRKRIASMGGQAFKKKCEEKRRMKEMLEACLEMKNKSGKTNAELVTLGLIKGAVKGNVANYRLILEILGELPKEEVHDDGLDKVQELLTKITEEATK